MTYTNHKIFQHFRLDHISHKTPVCVLAVDRRVWPVNLAPLHAAQRKDRITGIYYHKSETREDNISLSSLRYSWFSGKH